MPEEFLEAARKLEGKDIDVLLIHETLYLSELLPFIRMIYFKTALEAVRITKPKIVSNGHMHAGGYKNIQLPLGSQVHLHQ